MKKLATLFLLALLFCTQANAQPGRKDSLVVLYESQPGVRSLGFRGEWSLELHRFDANGDGVNDFITVEEDEQGAPVAIVAFDVTTREPIARVHVPEEFPVLFRGFASFIPSDFPVAALAGTRVGDGWRIRKSRRTRRSRRGRGRNPDDRQPGADRRSRKTGYRRARPGAYLGATALQEDVDGIGLSILSGAHNTIFPKILKLLRDKGSSDIVVFGGGIIPDEDMPPLRKAGVAGIFTPGVTTREVIDWVRTHVHPRAR